MLLLSPYHWPSHCHHMYMQTSYLKNQLLSSPLNPGNHLGTSLLVGICSLPKLLLPSMVTMATIVQTHLGLSAFKHHLMATKAFHLKTQYYHITSLLNNLPSCRLAPDPGHGMQGLPPLFKQQLLPLLHLQQIGHQPCSPPYLFSSACLCRYLNPQPPTLSPSLLRPPRKPS